jgi:transposase InsO family protein
MSHANAPLTPAGRLRLIERCRTRPLAHVAAEAGVSRACLSKWRSRYQEHGEAGLMDRSSAPHRSPNQTPAHAVTLIEKWRREHKWTARHIHRQLQAYGYEVSIATIGRWFVRLGINRRRFLDPTGVTNREPQRITARYPGHMIHVDVKKTGRIPNGGGWRVHGRDSIQARTVAARKKTGATSGYVYLHSAIDGYSRLAYTEALGDEKATTTIGFWSRAQAFLAAHGITRITRVITDNGANYRAAAFHEAVTRTASRHQRIRPYTPRHNGKVERYNRILAEEFLYARAWESETQRSEALTVWNIHYNYHRDHTSTRNRPPATQLHTHVTNVTSQNS